MYAVQGDLNNPSSDLDRADWSNFDVAVISMALHHVSEPIEMLSQLRKRLRPGGALTVVEMYEDDDQGNVTNSDNLNREDMIVVHGGQKIWTGFSPRGLLDLLEKAGFTDTDVKKPDLSFRIPDDVGGPHSGREKKLMFVKGVNGAASAL
jgi:SAM-dependent methyltransferase